jgi:hypothetical protein
MSPTQVAMSLLFRCKPNKMKFMIGNYAGSGPTWKKVVGEVTLEVGAYG